jgi:serpin B
MKKFLKVTSCVTMLLALTVILAHAPAGEPQKPDKNTTAAAQSNNGFALDMYTKLAENDGNIFFSPAGISTALAMTYAGARGETAAEMKKVLHFTLDDKDLHPAMGRLAKTLAAEKDGYALSIANALWGQTGFEFLKEFLEINKKNYNAGLKKVDFAGATEKTRKEINLWVEEKTKKMIKELLKPGDIDPETRLVLTNAIHFKGTWKYEFKKKNTKKENFYLAGGGVKVDMMHIKKMDFKYRYSKKFKALEMPYKGDEISMVIFLPNKGVGLAALEKELTSANIEKWLSRMYKYDIKDLAIPRFKMTCEFKLKHVLKKLGMKSAFGGDADFSGIIGSFEKNELFISDVIHKAALEVNEKGTTAAAATAVLVKKNGRPKIFRANRPFIFIIRHNKTGAILFMGRVVNPTGEKPDPAILPEPPRKKKSSR